MNQGQPTGSGPRRRFGKPLSVLTLWAVVGLVAGPVRAEGPTTRSSETVAKAPATQPAFLKPHDAKDLRLIEEQVEAVVKRVSPATVGVMIGAAQGSGVIINKDGFVLTAGHVVGQPNRDCTLVLASGRRVKATTLGANHGIDSGLIKITDKAPDGGWPTADMGKSEDLKAGEWVIALGHPGGYRKDRPPVLRLGRVLSNSNTLIATDCTLVGGDSGGPLFDLDGKVVGIHSRIGGSLLANIHVPVDTYSDTWDRLAKAEEWGSGFGSARGPMLGVFGENNDEPQGFKVTELSPNGPASKAGVKVGDLIVRMDDRKVRNQDALTIFIARHKAGDEVALVVLRDGKETQIKATLAKRPPTE